MYRQERKLPGVQNNLCGQPKHALGSPGVDALTGDVQPGGLGPMEQL